MTGTLVLAALGACLLGVSASFLMTRASNLAPIWNIALGGAGALVLAVVLYLLIVAVERAAFG
jgi:hypothetical protein